MAQNKVKQRDILLEGNNIVLGTNSSGETVGISQGSLGGGSSNPNEFVPATSADFTSPDATNAGKIWLIQNDIDLGGAVSDLPDGVELKDAGGSLINGTINLPKGRIDPFLLNYQLTVNEGQMYPTTYIFDPEKAGIVEQSTDFTDCENNRLRFNHIIKEVNKLKGNKISIGTLDAYFVVEIQLNRIKEEAEQELAIMFQSDIHYDLSEDTFLRVRPDNSFGSKLIHVFRCHGVKITGGNLMGDRFTHDYSPVNDSNGVQRNSHEFGTLLQISGSNYVTVENVRMEDSTADCIIIDGTSIRNADGTLIDGERISEDVVVRGCYLSQGRRNNISVLDGERIVIENNIITGAGNGFTPLDDNVINAAGRLPRTGIDIEPYQEPGTGADSEKFEDVANVIVRNNEFTKNYNADVNVFKGERILLENNRGTNILNCQFSNQVSVRNNSVRFDDTLVGGNVGTPKNGIQINNFLRVNAGGSFELVFANIIEGNTIRDFPGGISFDGRDAKVLNNNVYNSSIHGIELTDGENSQVRGNSIISDVTGVRGITSANGDCRAIVESNIIQISDGVGIYLSDVNDEDATSSKRIRIRRNTIKSPTIIDARNVYGLHFNENDIDLGGMELENIYNFEINGNKTLNTIPDRFINHFNNLVNGKIEDNVAVSSSTSTMTFNSSASAAIQNVIFNGNELENLTGSNVLGIFLNAVNNSNITISNNVFKKDANQNDILARAENKIIYGNYSVDGSPLKYSLEGTNTIFDDYSLINGTSQFVTQTTVELENSSRDLDLDDVNEIIYSGAGNPTFTIPNSSDVSWIPGQTIEFINDSSFNTITIVGSSGVIIKDNGLGNVISENGERKRLTYYKNNNWVLYGDRTIRENEILIKRPEQLEGVLESDKEYFLDGFININTINIVVPPGGVTFNSYGFRLGGFITNVADHTVFVSPAGGSGDLILKNLSITGNNANNSSVFALTDVDGTHAVEMSKVNFNDCTSLGYLDGYRQGLEENTGRFGGTPTLEFRGIWLGGYFIQTSIVRGITNNTYNLFQTAPGQTFASRFGGNPNIFIPSNVTAFEMDDSNFIGDELLQLDNATFSGTGSVFSGIDEKSTKVRVSRNTRGTAATYVGGSQNTTATAETTISTQNTLVPIEGTKTYDNLTWFSDGGANNALTYTSTQPSTVRVFYKGSFLASNNTTYEIVIRHWDDSASAYVDIETSTFTTNGGIASDGAEGVSFPTPRFVVDTNDRVEKWIRNITNTNNITERLNSKLIIEE